MQPQQDQNFWQPSGPVDGASSPGVPVVEETASLTDLHDEPLTWQASEFIHHEKSGIWFVALAGAAVALLLLDLLLIKSWTFGALIIVMAVAAGIVASRPPRTLTYSLSAQGVRIDEKLFSFHDFRAFGVIQEGAFYSIRLVPSKRFMPMVSVFFPSELGESIVDLFGSMLPMEQLTLDPIDKLVEKLRF